MLKNLHGICLMRLNDYGRAVAIYRELVLASGGMLFRNDVPVVFKTNFATALFLCNNVSGCVAALDGINDDGDTECAEAAGRRLPMGRTTLILAADRLAPRPPT